MTRISDGDIILIFCTLMVKPHLYYKAVFKCVLVFFFLALFCLYALGVAVCLYVVYVFMRFYYMFCLYGIIMYLCIFMLLYCVCVILYVCLVLCIFMFLLYSVCMQPVLLYVFMLLCYYVCVFLCSPLIFLKIYSARC